MLAFEYRNEQIQEAGVLTDDARSFGDDFRETSPIVRPAPRHQAELDLELRGARHCIHDVPIVLADPDRDADTQFRAGIGEHGREECPHIHLLRAQGSPSRARSQK